MKFTGRKGAFKEIGKIFHSQEVSKRIEFTIRIDRQTLCQQIEFRNRDKTPIIKSDQRKIDKLMVEN